MTAQSRKHRGGNRFGTPAERLGKRTSLTVDGCWEYTGTTTTAGYGYMVIAGQQTYVHRLAWELDNGPIPDGMVICHRCDYPPCVNPEHLFLGTIADNNRDMWAKGRGKLTPPAWRKIPLEAVPDIVERFISGEAKRDLAAEFGVTRQAIHYLLKREGAA